MWIDTSHETHQQRDQWRNGKISQNERYNPSQYRWCRPQLPPTGIDHEYINIFMNWGKQFVILLDNTLNSLIGKNSMDQCTRKLLWLFDRVGILDFVQKSSPSCSDRMIPRFICAISTPKLQDDFKCRHQGGGKLTTREEASLVSISPKTSSISIFRRDPSRCWGCAPENKKILRETTHSTTQRTYSEPTMKIKVDSRGGNLMKMNKV